MSGKWFYATIAVCLILISWTPLLLGSPAPVAALAVWLISGATVVGVGVGLAHIVLTKGDLFPGFDWDHEADSALLRRSRRWGALLGGGLTTLSAGGIVFSAWWYPRPDPRGIDATPEEYAIGPMFVASLSLGIGAYLLTVCLYRVIRVRRILRGRRELPAPSP